MTLTLEDIKCKQQDWLMVSSCFLNKAFFSFIAVLLLVCTSAEAQSTSKIESITLRATPLAFTPKEFYIANVIDERKDRTAVAYLLPATYNAAQPVITHAVDIQGGGLYAIKQFIRQSLTSNTKLRPVTIRLKECRITESPGANGRVNGKVVVTMAFDWQRDGETIHLVEYRGGGASYERSVTQFKAVEQALRQSLVSALRFLNTWMNDEVGSNEKLAQGIKVFFVDHTENNREDTVFYATNRPLTWDDFRDKPQISRFAASVFPSFSYEGDSKVVDGMLHINLTLKVYVLKNASWVKDNARDAYGLNHEQRHFDIVKLVVERFKQKIQPDNLTIEDFDSMIQYQFIESFREMNRVQEQYDGETRHGLDHAAQERWNRQIDEELSSFLVKK